MPAASAARCKLSLTSSCSCTTSPILAKPILYLLPAASFKALFEVSFEVSLAASFAVSLVAESFLPEFYPFLFYFYFFSPTKGLIGLISFILD